MKKLIDEVFELASSSLKKSYREGVGYFSCEEGSFTEEIWTRDTAFASFGLATDPKFFETIDTILKFQRKDGELPHRVEFKKHVNALVLGWLKKVKVDLVTRKDAFPIYNDTKGATPAIDTIPALIIACAKIFQSSLAGREFITGQYERIKLAIQRMGRLEDPVDGLACGEPLQDWLDCIKRPGKIAFVNALFLQAYKKMAIVARELNYKDDSNLFEEKFTKIRASFLKKFWNEQKHYFNTSELDDRIDVPANLLASIFLDDTDLSLKIHEAINKANLQKEGLLKGFDKPYKMSEISWRVKAFGMTKYGHIYLYPWIASLNILAKLSIASKLKDRNVIKQLLYECHSNLINLARVHHKNNGLYEILDDKTLKPAVHRILFFPIFRSSGGFLGSCSSYIGAYNELQKFNQNYLH